MTDNTLTSDEIKVSKQKLKAIHPHIVVGGSILKPYYSIEWYDIEKETTTIGFSSYSLPFVFKWMKEEFEVIDEDIDNLINRQKAEIERLNSPYEMQVEASKKLENSIKAEAVKEFAERFKEKAWVDKTLLGFPYYQITFRTFNNLVKEMVGESK